MKRVTLLLAVTFFAFSSFAQSSEGTSNAINLGGLLQKAYLAKTQSQPAAPVVQPATGNTPIVIERKSDVDLNVPTTNTVNNDGIAVVIGISNYDKTKNVDYAIHDARTVKDYLINTMGFKEGNIFYHEDATKVDFDILFGTKESHRGKVFNAVKPGKSDLFVFYAGHGAPDVKTNTGYFVPKECDPVYIEFSGYSTETFFNNLAQIPSRSTTVVTDACFSGAEILEGISPIGIKAKGFNAIENGVMLSSSAGTQVSSWYEDENHGLFTYFFLKAIQDRAVSDKNQDGMLTASEIYDYVSDKSEGVPYYARRFRNIDQTPTIQGLMRDNVLVNFNEE